MPDDRTNQETIVPATEPLPIVQGQQTVRQREARWLHLFLYILTSIIFAFFLVLAGRWVYHHYHHNDSLKTVPAGNNVPAEPQSAAPSKNKSQAVKSSGATQIGSAASTNKPSSSSSSSSSTSKSSSSSSSSTKSTSSSNQSSNSNLPNSGPGNMVAVFAGTSLLVGGAHYILNQKRAQNSV